MNILLDFIIKTFISAFFLWIAMKTTGERGSYLHLMLASAIASIAGLVPVLGFAFSIIVLVFLISKWTSAEVWPDAVLMVIVAWGLSWLATLLLLGQFLSCARG